MSRNSAQAKPVSAPGLKRSSSNILQRQNTLGSHICVQREASGPVVDSAAPSLVRDVIASPGRPLDANTRALMEPRFGHDFSRVRVHSDDQAAESARAVGANAYTARNHVAFGTGKYAPGTVGGHRLMAHELTHVVQQSSGLVAGTEFAPGFFVSNPADPFERKAALPTPVESAAHPSESTGPASGAIHLQRQSSQDGGLANAGAVAGIVGGVLPEC